MEKLGPNAAQVTEFARVARSLPAEALPRIEAVCHGSDERSARASVRDVRWSAAQHSALTFVGQELVRDLLRSYPEPSTTAETFTSNNVMMCLRAAIFALAARPKLDEETAGHVVAPFTDILGFDWRSTGVSSTTGKDTP